MTRFGVARRGSEDLALAAVVLAYGIASQRADPRRWQLPANLAAAVGAVAIARARGATWSELGLEREALPRGARVGVAALPVVGGAIALGAAVPASRSLFVDERVDDASRRELAYDALVRIPLATAVSEELIFRSALLGAGLHGHGQARAVASSSIAFGLWHVLPALRSYDANPAGARLADRVGGRPATVMATVAVTAVAGAGFAWLRLRSRSVVAPIVVHACINVAALAASAWVGRRERSARAG